jgi:hypothetical protein
VALVAVLAGSSGQRAVATAPAPTMKVTATNGYTPAEVNFLNDLGEVDSGLVLRYSGRTLFRLGTVACGDLADGDSDRQAVRAEEKYVAHRAASRISDHQVGELVPVAADRLCPAYLSAITTSVD